MRGKGFGYRLVHHVTLNLMVQAFSAAYSGVAFPPPAHCRFFFPLFNQHAFELGLCNVCTNHLGDASS